MISFNRTGLSRTLRQLITRLPRHVVPTALSFMASLAEMSITPAEPLRDRTTEFAFELDEFSAVLAAILGPTPNAYSRALSADELFFLKGVVIVLRCFTIFHATKVGLLAFKAHVI